jgi:hypothetical protein
MRPRSRLAGNRGQKLMRIVCSGASSQTTKPLYLLQYIFKLNWFADIPIHLTSRSDGFNVSGVYMERDDWGPREPKIPLMFPDLV